MKSRWDCMITMANTGERWFSHVAALAGALAYGFAAVRDEHNRFEYTAAMEWRDAAQLVSPASSWAGELCWRQWERIMQLPRRLAQPLGLDTVLVMPELMVSSKPQSAPAIDATLFAHAA